MPIGPFGDIGPCQLSWYGWTITSIHEDGANFRVAMSTADVHEAEYGTGAVDSVATGYEQCEFEAPFTRITFGNLQRLTPGSSLSGGSITTTGAVTGHGSTAVGRTLYSASHELIVKRIVDGVTDTDTQRWLHLFKTYPIPRYDLVWTLEGQRAFMVLFKVFPLQAAVGNDKIGSTWRAGGAEAGE